MAYAPPVTFHNYTNTHATHSNVPWSWTGFVPLVWYAVMPTNSPGSCEVRLFSLRYSVSVGSARARRSAGPWRMAMRRPQRARGTGRDRVGSVGLSTQISPRSDCLVVAALASSGRVHSTAVSPGRCLVSRPPSLLTLFPRRGFRRALSPRRVPSARPLRLAPWASGVAPGLIRTARARATIVQESAKCENTDVCISWAPFLALERSSEKAFKNAKHGSQLLRSSS